MRLFPLPRQLAQFAATCLLTLAAATAAHATADTTATPATTGSMVPDTGSTKVPLDTPPKTQADVDRLSAHAQQHGVPTPAGWTGISMPSVRGHIRAADTDDSAIVMYNQSLDLGAVVMVTFTPDGGDASILKTFKFNQVYPPQLTLLAPGDYVPMCHAGTPCEKVHSKNQVISLCFAEASCSLLYYDGQQLREVAMTD